MVEVEFADGSRNFVMPATLDSLLEQRKIVGFKRSAGWVTVGFDPIRMNTAKLFRAPERRRRNSIYRVEYI